MPSLGTSFGRGGATTFQQDLQHSDCIVIEGSNMAECHPVGFQWVMEAKKRGARVIHVDPRFTRTSAVADQHVPIRAGSDIAFLGGIIRYVLDNELDFREYVTAYTNAAVILREDFVDTEELDGLFSGFDPESGKYDPTTWQYEGHTVHSSAGKRRRVGEDTDSEDESGQTDESADDSAEGHQHGSGGAAIPGPGKHRDLTLQDPRCVYQVLKRHYARYTPEMVSDITGVSVEEFLAVCEAVTANSGRDRTTAFVYSVGWTHHSVGVQYIRTAAVLQTLLGNMGRPGGGIMALRGHASIQGSTDIPTLFNILPGYLPMPKPQDDGLAGYTKDIVGDMQKGFWTASDAYMISLLKSYFGEAATAENDYGFDWLPRINGDHGSYQTVLGQIDGTVEGYFVVGENPAVGHAHGKLQRKGLASCKWLVVRDMQMIETATFWKDAPEIETGELKTEEIDTEVFFFPAASHVEKAGSFTQTQRLLQWRHKAVEPPGDCESDLDFFYRLGRLCIEAVADSDDPRDKALQNLTWDYGETEADPEQVLMEINGRDLTTGKPLGSYTEMKADGSTDGGCWIYTGVYADGVNQAARRKPGQEQSWVAPEWGWAWPANRRQLYNRASADPGGKPWSERKALVWWDAEAGEWTGHDVPDFVKDKAPSYRAPEGSRGPEALDGDDPFVMQADGKAWLFVPSGLLDGPMPTHYEPAESPVTNALYSQQANPTRQVFDREDTPNNPSAPDPGADVFPFVMTTYRLTEHHTAGGMSRWLPKLNELQPAFFCEVSPELAAERGLEHNGWATIISTRSAIEARVLVTERMRPLKVGGRVIHQVGLPYHWGPNGLSVGDSANDLFGLALDRNVHIQESKAASCDIQPGRRPRGPAVLELVAQYQQRSGMTTATGTDVVGVGEANLRRSKEGVGE